MSVTATAMMAMTLLTCCGRGLWGGVGAVKIPVDVEQHNNQPHNSNDYIADDNKNGNDDEMTNNEDHTCGRCRKAYNSRNEDVTRLGEIALAMMMSKA